MKQIKDSNGNKYFQTEDGTCYHAETPTPVISALETARKNSTRIRIFLGDRRTGLCWNEENDVTGTVGRSTGTIKIPLLINNSRSYGGGGILTHCIVKIVDTQTKRVLYKNPNFYQDKFSVTPSDMKEYTANVCSGSNKDIYARCKSINQANRLAGFMNGTRMSK